MSGDDLWRRVIEMATVGIAFSDGRGAISEANDAFLKLVGATRGELARNEVRWSAITPLEYAPLDERARLQLIRTGLGAPYEKEYLRKDGTRVAVLVATADLDPPNQAHVSFVIDLTQQKRIEHERAAILEREREARAEAETLNRVGLTLSAELDADKLIVALTEAAMEITGARFGAFREDMLDLSLPESSRGWRSYLKVPVTSRSGEIFGALIFGHPNTNKFNDHHQRVVFGIAAQAAVAIDNARFYRANADARREAEAASRLKDEFLAIVSHELRTPLNAILGWAQVLRAGSVTREQSDQGLETIERNAKAQAQLIDDLLDVSRIISGKLLLDVQKIDPLLPIENALETVRSAADAKGIEIARSIGRDVGLVLADSGRLQQIVWNLISNAIKFTPLRGRVEIAVEKIAGHVEINIHDTGVGIKKEFLPHVFDRFRQADASSTRRFGGLGLGLAIVRHLVELHGGTVRAQSDGEDRGAHFTVSFPAAEGRFEVPALGRTTPRPQLEVRELDGLRVLVVDDDADARELLKLMLEESRATVETVGSASDAMRAMLHFRPHVIVSDIGMPHEDGYSLIRRVRALPQEQGGETPAIALTAFVRHEDRTRALQAGYQVHVAKPVEPSELMNVVVELSKQPGPAGSARSPSAPPGSPGS